MAKIELHHISLFRSLFRGREDVFALRWEKAGKNGYMPAYFFDSYRFRAHKMKGGSFQDYPDKAFLQLTDLQITKHLNGDQLIGLYPLLQDNTSWFIAADFDKENWADDCKIFLEMCKSKDIPAYLERSRSGKGGHVWIFFEAPYPATKSRKMLLTLLRQTNIISQFDKNSSFDRLFPNQDFLSGKGLGNLIALPLHKLSMTEGNACFVEIKTMKAYDDQWHFLASIERVSVAKLDSLFQELESKPSLKEIVGTQSEKLQITLNESIHINRNAIPIGLVNFIKEELNFANTEFFIKKKTGRNTFGTTSYFKSIEETKDSIFLPKGFAGKLLRYCRECKIDYEFIDRRQRHDDINYAFDLQLRAHQIVAIDAVARKDFGVIVAPPGSGKTVVGLKIISEKRQPALIIVHRKQLAEQWLERIETFLGIPKNEIGKIGQGKNKIGKRITIATIQSLSKELENGGLLSITNAFGAIIVDECHHVPAESFRNTIAKLNSFYLYGLTATPFRKYSDGKLIFIHLGEIICELKAQDIAETKAPKIVVRATSLDVPFNSKTDKFETLSKILIHDSTRNKLVLQDIEKEINGGKKVVVVTERKEHIDSLHQYLKQLYEVIAISGDDSESSRTAKWQLLKGGNYQAVITTGQFFGEGTDLQNANCLFLVYPFSFEGKLIQYIGRVQRSEITPIIYDYRDSKIDYLNKLFLKRNTYYRKLEKQNTLVDDPVEEIVSEAKTLVINKEIKVPIEKLDFRFGGIAFVYEHTETNSNLEFEIENDVMRPEFEVLKPYFAKALNSKTVTIVIHATFQNNLLVSQIATSEDISKMNKELVEGLRFKFITKTFSGKKPPIVADEKSTGIMNLQDSDGLYESGEELLQSILTHQQFKHSKQLRYLAVHHLGHVLKLRFILSPFSFVFLLQGNEQFHIVLETLDTEEATYIWHFDKDIKVLPQKLKEIDTQLNVIRNKGRQLFLETQPADFNRLQHDYTNEKKGFVVWKDLLEEQLV